MPPPPDHTVRLSPHGATVIANNSPLENLCTFTLIFLIGALWGHMRGSSRDTRPKELAS